MKKFIARLLIVVLLVFCFLTNPSTEEYAAWSAAESLDGISAFPLSDRIEGAFAQYLELRTERTDYLFCSLYNYNGSMTLGIAHRFFPLDELNTQIETLRADFTAWAEENIH